MKCAIVPVTAYQQNCSILICEATGKAALVDPGGDLDRIEAALTQAGAEYDKPIVLEKIFLTHGHLDHCAGADEARKKYSVPIEGPHKADINWLNDLPKWTEYNGFPHADALQPDRWLEEGDTISFGEQTLQVLFTPGHSPGHVVFFHAGVRLAISGDTLFQGSIGRTDLPEGDHAQLMASIRDKLLPLGDDVALLPGHGPTTTIGRERQSNPFLVDSRYG